MTGKSGTGCSCWFTGPEAPRPSRDGRCALWGTALPAHVARQAPRHLGVEACGVATRTWTVQATVRLSHFHWDRQGSRSLRPCTRPRRVCISSARLRLTFRARWRPSCSLRGSRSASWSRGHDCRSRRSASPRSPWARSRSRPGSSNTREASAYRIAYPGGAGVCDTWAATRSAGNRGELTAGVAVLLTPSTLGVRNAPRGWGHNTWARAVGAARRALVAWSDGP
jgi:hypothetical protein